EGWGGGGGHACPAAAGTPRRVRALSLAAGLGGGARAGAGGGRAAPAEGEGQGGPLVPAEREPGRPRRRARGLWAPRARDRDHGRRESEQPGERDLGRGRISRRRDPRELVAARQTARAAGAPERRGPHHGQVPLHATRDG